MNPYVFLEYGEYIFNRIAPLRGITFCEDAEGAPFPTEELAACPLLRRLDLIGFKTDALPPGHLQLFLRSPHLVRAWHWELGFSRVSLADYEAFAANEHTRRALWIKTNRLIGVPSDRGPIGEVSGRFDIYPWHHFGVSAEGAALEKRYGYLPWLHLGNHASAENAHYWVEHRVVPLYEPGSPAETPVRYGKGFGEQRALEPRAGFDLDEYSSLSY